MNSKQIFMIVTIIAALSAAMIATPVMAQNMSGGNMTGGNTTGSISSIDDIESSTFSNNQADGRGGGAIDNTDND
jgi:hypothetical protein